MGLVINCTWGTQISGFSCIIHFSPRYPEVNTRVVRVLDYWPNLPFFTFLTKKSKILCDNSFTHDFFHRVIIKFRIKIVQKLCHFEIINPQLQFFDKNIQNLKNFKVINEYLGTHISNWRVPGPGYIITIWDPFSVIL